MVMDRIRHRESSYKIIKTNGGCHSCIFHIDDSCRMPEFIEEDFDLCSGDDSFTYKEIIRYDPSIG